MSDKVDLDKLLKGFNLCTEEAPQIKLKNPILNGMFHGGLPKGSVIQIAAQSGVGKSTLVVQIAKELCELGQKVAYIDAENGLNMNMMESTGIKKYLYTAENPNGQFLKFKEYDCNQVNLLLQNLANNHLADTIILDSLGALDSGIYLEGGTSADAPKVGADTKSLKIVLKTMNAISLSYGITIIFINHLAQSIGTYIPQENPTGGRAPIYLSDIIIKLTKKSSEYEKQNLGQKVEYEATKSRFGAGKVKVPFYIRFGKGISMIPTYREILPNLLDKDGNHILEVHGGGFGTLHLNGQDLKYRGDAQLTQLVIDHYSEIKNIVPDDIFVVKPEKAPEDEFLDGCEEISNEVPDDLKDIKVVKETPQALYYEDGVDSTGQIYSIHYRKATNTLILEYDSQEEETLNPTKKDYNDFQKTLKKYLKSLT